MLVADGALLDSATEEFLRFYPPARTHARTVTHDVEFAGCPMHAGTVLLSEISANRDGRSFPDADRFVIDRFPNRHVSFGCGSRFPGSHLARLEFRTKIRRVLDRLPDFVLDEAGVQEYPNWSMLGGWAAIPVTFTAGPRPQPAAPPCSSSRRTRPTPSDSMSGNGQGRGVNPRREGATRHPGTRRRR